MRWRGLKEAGHELDLPVRRIGPILPTIHGGVDAAERWLPRPTAAVIAYNDLVVIGFIQAVIAAGRRVPRDVSVIGFDNIVDAGLVEPGLTSIAAPLVSLGSTTVSYLATRREQASEHREPVLQPALLVLRGSTGPHH